MRSSRRQFLLGTAALLGAAGCGFGQSSNSEVETLGGDPFGGSQPLDSELSLAVPADALPADMISAFEHRTNVHVRVQRVATDEDLLLGIGAGATGTLDAVLVGGGVLAQLIAQKLVEPIDRSLVPGRDGIESPYDDPPYDGGLRHGVPQDITPIGFAALASARLPSDSWAGFFQLAKTFPGRVDVPDDPALVIGAMLVSLGHDWNSDDGGDLDEAARELRRLRSSLIVLERPRRVAVRGAIAALSPGYAYRGAIPPVRFVVPEEGTAVQVRSWCIPVLAPDPVTAHAWLENALDPVTAAAWTRRVGRASPVTAARDLLPASVLSDPAVFPPASSIPNLLYENLSDDGRALRQEVWHQLRT